MIVYGLSICGLLMCVCGCEIMDLMIEGLRSITKKESGTR